MKAEALFRVQLDEFAWGQTRERERANRGKVCVLVGKGGRVVSSRKNTVTLEPTSAVLLNVRRYATEDAAGVAVALSAKVGRTLVPVDVYDFAKARQYCARAALVKLSKESK